MAAFAPTIVYHKGYPGDENFGIALGVESFTEFENVNGQPVPKTELRVLVAWNSKEMRAQGFPALHAREELVWHSIPDVTDPNGLIPPDLDEDELKDWIKRNNLEGFLADLPEDQREILTPDEDEEGEEA